MNRKLFYFLVLLCAALLALAPASNSKKYPMIASDIATGATAQLQVAKEKRGRGGLEVKTNTMAKPRRLQPLNIAYCDLIRGDYSPSVIRRDLFLFSAC